MSNIKVFCHNVIFECVNNKTEVYALDVSRSGLSSTWKRFEVDIIDMKLSDLDMCAYFSHAYDIDVYIPKIKVLNYPMPDMGGNWLLFTNETLFIEGTLFLEEFSGNLIFLLTKG